MYTFIKQGHIQLIKSDSKDTNNDTKYLYFKKCCSFWASYEFRKNMYNGFRNNIKQQNWFYH